MCLFGLWVSQKSVHYCAIPLKTMALSRYCVISLLQFMTSLKVIALETLFLLIFYFQAQSPKKTRRSFSATNFVDYCFFCDNGNGSLLSCRSKNLDKHVSEWAEYLRDSKLLAKLSEGDMTATEAKYHRKCLTELYNRVKSKRNDEKSETELFTVVEGNE